MSMLKFRAAMARRLDDTKAASQRDVPAANLRNQIAPKNLGPKGNTGEGYTPAAHEHTTDGQGGPLTADEHLTYSEYQEIGTPSTPAANKARVYVKDKSGISALYYLDDAGIEHDLSAPGGVPAGTVGDMLTFDVTGTLAIVAAGIEGSSIYWTDDGSGNILPIADIRAPQGGASGDLSGVYPGPTVTGLYGVLLSGALATPSDGDTIRFDLGSNSWGLGPSGGGGTVTSVGLTAPAEFTVTSSPVTSSGVIDIAWAAPVTLTHGGTGADLSATGGANQIVRQNTSGGAFTVSVLAAGDIPNLDWAKITTGLPTTLGGYGITDAYTKAAADARYAPISVTGSVTSVALALPSLFSVSGSPVTGSGTLTGAFANQSANTVLAGPVSGGAAAPSMRALDEADIPNHAYTKLTYSGLTTGQVLRATGTTAAAFGALNLATAAAITGLLPAGNGGTGVNNAGTITNASNTTITGGGTLALGGFTLTAPATGTAALLGLAQTFTAAQTINADLDTRQFVLVRNTGASGYGLRFGDGTTQIGAFQTLDSAGSSTFFFSANRQFDTGWQQLNARVGGSLLMSDSLSFYSFPAASSVPTLRFSVTNAGVVNASDSYRVANTQVLTARQTGWNAPTGTLARGTFAVTGATIATVAQALAALITDLRTHGLIST